MSIRQDEHASSGVRSRRVDDALSRLIDSFLPPLTLADLDEEENYVATKEEAEETLAAAEEQRHRDKLDRAWNIIQNFNVAHGADHLASSSLAENINNASDLIKRKLLRENATPDKAARFSNLYSRLLTQPLLNQKWAILYLLYSLSDSDGDKRNDDDGGDRGRGVAAAIADRRKRRSRSPLMEDGNLENILLRASGNSRFTSRLRDDDDDGPAISSSVSQRGGRDERSSRTTKRATDELQKRRPMVTADRKESITSRAQTEHKVGAPEIVIAAANTTTSPTEINCAIDMPLESALLRDVPFILQGLSTTNAEFTSPSILELPLSLPVPMVSMLHTLAEPCLLYKNLSAFVEETAEGGLVRQALRAAIGNELRSYLSLVATLEGEIRRVTMAASNEKEPGTSVKGAVTLKRCVVWTRDATMALRLMSLVVEEARGTFPTLPR
jgi:gamma-tubulin complex component 3